MDGPAEARFDALLDEWRSTPDEAKRNHVCEELWACLPELDEAGDTRRMASLLPLPGADSLVDTLKDWGTSAVPALLEVAVATDAGGEGRARAVRALREMWSDQAVPGLKAAISLTQDDEVKNSRRLCLSTSARSTPSRTRSRGTRRFRMALRAVVASYPPSPSPSCFWQRWGISPRSPRAPPRDRSIVSANRQSRRYKEHVSAPA